MTISQVSIQNQKTTTLNTIVDVLWTPITWSMIADILGVKSKNITNSLPLKEKKKSNPLPKGKIKPGQITIQGVLGLGADGAYKVNELEFDITPNTCIVGDMTLNSMVKVKILITQGKRPYALSVVIVNQQFCH